VSLADLRAVLEDGEISWSGGAARLQHHPRGDGVRRRAATCAASTSRCRGAALWDFPDGTLAGREVAAYLVSETLGWDVVPLTVERDGPLGPGMVQLWCDPDEEQQPVDVVPVDEVPDGYLHVLDAEDGRGHPVALVHEDTAQLRRMAVFDAVVNNADRGGTCSR
jgi:uncharacterized repeat protein (TIGR03843 family)